MVGLACHAGGVILNEVNSSDPSRLSGYTEIAGGRADLVIANPAGISCPVADLSMPRVRH